jgi:DNA-binding XRE family transcriptional regulator
MADLRGPFGAAGPVVTCVVSGIPKRSAVGLRARQDIVPLVVIRRAGDDLAFFSESRRIVILNGVRQLSASHKYRLCKPTREGRLARGLRLKREMTQQELADACGLDIRYIGGIERGHENPSFGALQGIASVFGMKTSDLLRKAKL